MPGRFASRAMRSAWLVTLVCGTLPLSLAVAQDLEEPLSVGNGPSDISVVSDPNELQQVPDADPEPSPIEIDAEVEAADEPAPVQPARFNGIQPGGSTSAELKKAWGEPAEKKEGEQGDVIYTYSLKAFPQVEVTCTRNVVRSILINLSQSISPALVAEQLGLDDSRSVDVPDASGNPIGKAFPERGVLFSYAPDEKIPQVAQIVLEPIDPQPFVLRAERRLHGPYEANLRDLKYATQLDEKYAHAYWLMSQVLLAVGRVGDADQAAAQAVQLESDVPEYRLTWSRVLARQGDHEKALAQVQQVLKNDQLPIVVRARALLMLGELTASGRAQDARKAVELYTQAIQLADPLSVDPHPDVRHAAFEVLVDGHLAVARDIAWGHWEQKPNVVPMWIERASEFAEKMIDGNEHSLEMRLRVAQHALGALAGFQPAVDPSEWVRQAQQTSDRLCEDIDDPLWKKRVHWQLGQAYFHALQIRHARGDTDEGLKYGKLAMKYLESGADNRETAPGDDHLIGQFFFQMGALHAVHLKDHKRAVFWYEKAAPSLIRPTPVSVLTNRRRHGEALVSMGVSYWDAGQREKGVELTKMGAEIIQKAIQGGWLDETALSVPYGNLASMHEQLGDDQRARDFAELADRSQNTTRR